MKVRTPITLALLVAAIAAPAARPTSPPNALQRAHAAAKSVRPDVQGYRFITDTLGGNSGVAASAKPAPDWFDRYLKSHGLITDTLGGNGGVAASARPSPTPPGFENPARTPQTRTPVEQVVPQSGFAWGDFAIGAGSMLGVLLLLGGFRIAAHAMRSKHAHPSPA